MTNGQRFICSYLNSKFGAGTIRKKLLGNSEVKVTNRKEDSITVSCNIFGDIMISGTKTILATSDLPHDLNKVSLFAEPTAWKDGPGKWPESFCELIEAERQSVKAMLQYNKSQIEKNQEQMNCDREFQEKN